MATVTVTNRVCDITGKRATSENPVRVHRVRVCSVNEDGGDGDELFVRELELRPDGLDRLLNFVKRGTSKPGDKVFA